MKRLMIIIAVLAMGLAFLPKVYAEGNTASLNLQVTFAPSEPLRIWTERDNLMVTPAKIVLPENGRAELTEGDYLIFKVIAEDLDTINVSLRDPKVPMEARFTMDPIQPISSKRREGHFYWETRRGQGREEPYYLIFEANNTEDEIVSLTIEVLLHPAPPLEISVTIEPDNWVLQGVKLGEQINNLNATGIPVHQIKNTGNIPVMVEIGYAPIVIPEQEIGSDGEIIPHSLLLPGLEQGLNRYITKVGETIIPPPQNYFDYANYPRIRLDRSIEPGMAEPLPLTYGAPTALSEPVEGMSVSYEVKACPLFLI